MNSLIGGVILLGLLSFLCVVIYIYLKMAEGFIKLLKGKSTDWQTRTFWALTIFGISLSSILGLIWHNTTDLFTILFAFFTGIFLYLYLYKYEAKIRKTILWDERILRIKEKASYLLVKAELFFILLLSTYFSLQSGFLFWQKYIFVSILLISSTILLYVLFSESKLDEREKMLREKLSYVVFKIEFLLCLFVSAYFFAMAKFRDVDKYNIYGLVGFAAFMILWIFFNLFKKFYEFKM